jgi:branched-chain amino acid transport system ATP-binding protein
MLFEVRNLSVNYRKAKAVHDVSLSVDEGEIVTVIGANGAGKTTTLRTICGLMKPTSGSIWFQNKRIDGMPPYKVFKLGIVQIPAGRMIFATMTVLDNLKLGCHFRKDKAKIKQDFEAIYTHFPRLKERQSQMAGQLSGGEQQMLAIARAVIASPKLLLLDEPSLGLSPILIAEVAKIIRDINKDGIPVLLVEQNCRIALRLAQRAYVLELGSVALSGDAADLANDERIKKLYLGGT